MIIAGVDVGSRHTAICEIYTESQTQKWYALNRKKDESFTEYLRTVREWAYDALGGVTVVWIEQPFGNNPRALFQLGAVAGAVASCLPEGVSVDFVGASEWKKLVGLPGNARKPTIIEWAYAETGVALTEHTADAYGLARAILAHGAKEKA